MLASMFLVGGLDALRNPGPKVPMANPVAPKVAAALPGLPDHDTALLVRLNGGVQVGAGTLLAFGRFPRLSALAASLAPTTAAGHRFWEYDDRAQRQQQQIHFFKNLSMLGGLLLAAMDTEGKPGFAWRAPVMRPSTRSSTPRRRPAGAAGRSASPPRPPAPSCPGEGGQFVG